jgi:hypothetical protein
MLRAPDERCAEVHRQISGGFRTRPQHGPVSRDPDARSVGQTAREPGRGTPVDPGGRGRRSGRRPTRRFRGRRRPRRRRRGSPEPFPGSHDETGAALPGRCRRSRTLTSQAQVEAGRELTFRSYSYFPYDGGYTLYFEEGRDPPRPDQTAKTWSLLRDFPLYFTGKSRGSRLVAFLRKSGSMVTPRPGPVGTISLPLTDLSGEVGWR